VNQKPVFAPFSPLSWFRTFREIRKDEPEIIIFNWWIPFFAFGYFAVALLTKLFTKTKIVFLVHNAIPHEKWLFSESLTKLAFSQSDYFLTLSEQVAKDVETLKPRSKILRSEHPVYDFYLSENETKEILQKQLGIKTEKVLLFFGFIKKYKGLDFLLQALPKILKSFDVTLLIVGEFYYPKTDYEKLVQTLGIEKNIKLVDFYVPNEEVYKYFMASDVVILPYTSATQSGIVQLCFGFEKPIVATKVGGIPEVVKDNFAGLLAEPENSEDLAAKIIEFYNKNLGEKFSKNIKSEKQKYSWENLIEVVTNLKV
ncbi:glycosyltransferase, partial [bacterium]|nr:glycosyltransferase [bacterium]